VDDVERTPGVIHAEIMRTAVMGDAPPVDESPADKLARLVARYDREAALWRELLDALALGAQTPEWAADAVVLAISYCEIREREVTANLRRVQCTAGPGCPIHPKADGVHAPSADYLA
jgi:hypothetical protein